MELNTYRLPISWTSKGQDWENPKADIADYVMAIREAIIERCMAANITPKDATLRITADVCVLEEAGNAMLGDIRKLIPQFINLDYYEYDEDYSDFPHYWTWEEIVNQEGCEIFREFTKGQPIKDSVITLKAMYKVLNLLRYHDVDNPKVVRYTGSGSIHDPPFGTATSEAISEANNLTEKELDFIPDFVQSWSGNTHYHDHELDESGEWVKKDGYCGYAKQQYFKLISFDKRIPDRGCKLVTLVVAKALDEPLNYSNELQSTTFSSNGSAIKEGVNFFYDTIPATPPNDLEIIGGHDKQIPVNKTVPKSDFDADGNPICRRSTILGYEGSIYMFVDYGTYAFRFFEKVNFNEGDSEETSLTTNT